MALQDTDLLAAQRGTTTYKVPASDIKTYAAGGVPAASETVQGKVELATAAETAAGTDNTRAVHPAGLKPLLDAKAPLASPALTGTPTAPTAAPGTDTTQLATTAFVTAAVTSIPGVGDATETTKGVVELADNAESVAGTDNTRAVHPAGMAAAIAAQADPAGTASASMAAHVGEADPHAQYALESSLSAVATSGSYNDLLNRPTLVTSLDGLSDVDLTTPPTDGQVLTYSTGTGQWIPGTGGGGGGAVDSVFGRTGTVVAQEGDYALGQLGDVDLTVPPTDAQVLSYNNATGQWVPATVSTSSPPDASETVKGIVELATAAETATGTDNSRAVHPAGLKAQLDLKAPLASPALTGTPTAPTASAGTNTTQLATTAFVASAVTSAAPPNASETVRGIVELATSAETTTGTDTTRAVHPAGLKAVVNAERTTSDNRYVDVAGDTMTGVLRVVVGSETAPGVSFSNDSDTGFFRPGINQFGIATAATERIRVGADGLVTMPTNDAVISGVTVGQGSAKGQRNVCVGTGSLAATTTGTDNTAIGDLALSDVAGGSSNVAAGAGAMGLAQNSSHCVAVGANALAAMTTGASNTAVGRDALNSLTTGGNNIGVGREAGGKLTVEGSNLAIGSYAARNTTGGTHLIAVGSNVAQNITGGTNTGNVCIGEISCYSATSAGDANVFIGRQSGYNCLNLGDQNVAIGYRALAHLPTSNPGSYNVGIGSSGGRDITTGKGNTCIGPVTSTGTFFPAFTITTENDRLSMGHQSVTNAYVKVAWTVVSDARDKTDFAPVPHGLEFVKQLKPTAYRFRVSRDDATPSGPVRYGFLAQEILALEGANPVVIDKENEEQLRYQGESLVPILVNAIKEQQAIIESLAARLDAAGL